jgi:hypothetical protein
MITVVSDFFEDVRRDSETALAHHGVKLPSGSDVHLAVVECFHLERRLIRPVPRHVLRSRQLLQRVLTEGEREAVQTIVHELEQGVDVRPRMTNTIRKAGYNDGLLTDWGIHHLHLGKAMRPDKFIERTGPLLFLFVVGRSAHLLDLLAHDSFEDDDLVEIIHENWPDVIRPWLAPGFTPGSLSPDWTPESRKMARRKFSLATQTKDGTIYLPPGGGIVTSGHSSEAVKQANALLNLVAPARDWVREQADWIAAQIDRMTGTRPTELRMRFDMSATLMTGRAVVRETTTRVVLMGVPPDPDKRPSVAHFSSRPPANGSP